MDSNDRIVQLVKLMSDNYEDSKGEDSIAWNWDKIKSIKLCPYDCYNLFNFWNKQYQKNTKYLSMYEIQSEMLKNEAKLFSINDSIKNLLTNLDPKNVLNEINLPFECLFIDTNLHIEASNTMIFGVFLQDLHKCYEGISYEEQFKLFQSQVPNLSEENFKENYYRIKKDRIVGCSVLFYTKEKDAFQFTDFYFSLRTLKASKRLLLEATPDKYQNIIEEYIAKFIANLLLFLNEPRVTIYTQEANNIRRKKKGLISIPSLLKTKIEIGLQNYIERIYFNGLSHSKLGFAFWVRGHRRRFLSPRFVNKQGQTIWINAHICGEGLMPPQIFEVTN